MPVTRGRRSNMILPLPSRTVSRPPVYLYNTNSLGCVGRVLESVCGLCPAVSERGSQACVPVSVSVESSSRLSHLPQRPHCAHAGKASAWVGTAQQPSSLGGARKWHSARGRCRDTAPVWASPSRPSCKLLLTRSLILLPLSPRSPPSPSPSLHFPPPPLVMPSDAPAARDTGAHESDAPDLFFRSD